MQWKKIILILAAALLLAGGGYYFYSKSTTEKIKLLSLTETTQELVVNRDSLRFAPLIPAATGYVNDFGYYFTPQQADTLKQIIRQQEKASTNQITIVTFNTLPIAEQDFDAFTKALANKWGVGQKGKNNGITIALCRSLRKIRIQNGDGITVKFSDAATKEIIDKVIFPEFAKGDYYNGIKKGLLAIIAKLNI